MPAQLAACRRLGEVEPSDCRMCASPWEHGLLSAKAASAVLDGGRRRGAFLVLGIVVVGGLFCAGPEAASGSSVAPFMPVRSCGQLRSVSLNPSPGTQVTITSATVGLSDGYAYCDVAGVIKPEIRFKLKLPVSTWGGRYVQEGCGGYCGEVIDAPPPSSAGCPPVTGHTLALGTDDEGHQSRSLTDGRWAADNRAFRGSFGYTSEHELAVTAKAVIGAVLRAPASILVLRRVFGRRARGLGRGSALSA